MKNTHYFAATAFAMLLICSPARAQSHGGAPTMRIPSVRIAPAMASPVAFSRTVRQMPALRVSPSGRQTSGFIPFTTSSSLGIANNVPGLGFDYPHLAAISGGLTNGRSPGLGLGTRHRQGTIVPILVGGYSYYDPSGFYGDTSAAYEQPQPEQQPVQQPQVIVIQQPVPASPVDSGNAPAALASANPAPVPDVGEFVLVRRDGRVLFASAFFISGAQVAYVTPEGIRHTVPLTDLDADATRQMNEARGSTVQIHD